MWDDSIATIHQIGHRAFVGGDGPIWDAISRLQFDYLCSQGLKRSDRFVDIGCGALRGGRRFIEFLDPTNYHGIDKFIELVIYGVNSELGIETYREKKPRFVISDKFEFGKFEPGTGFSFGVAQSLFTHLTSEDIRVCLANMAKAAVGGCRIFCTFLETNTPQANIHHSHSLVGFYYTRGEMEALGAATGWFPRYIGEWGHPRKQSLIEYVR